jgi:hypothetical protein
LRSQLDTIVTHLKALEELEVDHFPHSSLDLAEIEEALSQLGVPSGIRWTSDQKGRIHLTPKGFTWWMGNEHIVDSVSTATLKNMGKLKYGLVGVICSYGLNSTPCALSPNSPREASRQQHRSFKAR